MAASTLPSFLRGRPNWDRSRYPTRTNRILSVIQPPLDKDDRALGRLIEPLGATVILNADANADGKLTLPELIAFEGKRFDDADKDHDGEVSPQELRAARGGDSDFPDPRAFGGTRQP